MGFKTSCESKKNHSLQENESTLFLAPIYMNLKTDLKHTHTYNIPQLKSLQEFRCPFLSPPQKSLYNAALHSKLPASSHVAKL